MRHFCSLQRANNKTSRSFAWHESNDVKENRRWYVEINFASVFVCTFRVISYSLFRSLFTFFSTICNWRGPRHPLSLFRLCLFRATPKWNKKQSNGSTRVKGSGLSSRTTGARKSSSTSRTWKRKDFAVYERYEIRFLASSPKKGRAFFFPTRFPSSKVRVENRRMTFSFSSFLVSFFVHQQLVFSSRTEGKGREETPKKSRFIVCCGGIFLFFPSCQENFAA